jgi:hypothetical protein
MAPQEKALHRVIWTKHGRPIPPGAALKEKVLAKTTPIKAKRARFRPDDELLSFLKTL